MTESGEDLDLFLTGVESKLRGPFSSLDLAKAIQTAVLRGSHTPKQYLGLISQVFARPDKVIQLRILVGMLGLQHSEQTDESIQALLQQAQNTDDHEEWVRIVAGLIQGMMLQDPASDAQPASLFGEEAQGLLQKTSSEVLEQIEQFMEEAPEKQPPDLNPHFAPTYYGLLGPGHLRNLIPVDNNPHFNVNNAASILHLDEKLEEQRAKEDLHQQKNLPQRGVTSSSNGSSSRMGSKLTSRTMSSSAAAMKRRTAAAKGGAALPGSRTMSKTKSRTAVASSRLGSSTKGSSLFMPSRKPVANRGPAAMGKPGLHTRKAGAARSLLSKGRMGQRSIGGAQKTMRGTTQRGRTISAKSKMKMIDVSEVGALNKEQQQRDEMPDKAKSKKRRILDAAQQSGLLQNASKKSAVAKSQSEDGNVVAPASAGDGGGAATDGTSTGHLFALQQEEPQSASPQHGAQSEWKIMLENRSNRLSSEDRERVRQFFEDQHNPVPDQQSYRVKMHEQKIADPNTGQAIKETYYLELDYQTFTSKQSKKIKRY